MAAIKGINPRTQDPTAVLSIRSDDYSFTERLVAMFEVRDGCDCVWAVGNGKAGPEFRPIQLPAGFIYKVKP